MNHRKFNPSFPWSCYSKKLAEKIYKPRHVGCFTTDEAKERHMRLASGSSGSRKEGSLVCLYWLVDEEDGVIADAKFQVFGSSALIGAAETACELLIRKNYDQALRLSAELLDKQVQGKEGVRAFPAEVGSSLTLVLAAIEQAAHQCLDISFAENYVPTPLASAGHEGGLYPNWNQLSAPQKLGVIEQVIADDIRPYIELDAGGIQIVSFTEQKLTIAYQGACTSCYSATGATLDAIQNILRAKVDPGIVVIPDASFLQMS